MIVTAMIAGCNGSDAQDDVSGATTSDSTTTTTAMTASPADESLRGKRYCEVLLVSPTSAGVQADVYNSFPMNDCPQSEWEALDPTALARANAVPIALLNGPRYWLMDRIEQSSDAVEATEKTFGEIEMVRRATVKIASLAESSQPYAPNRVARSTVFSFDAGSTVYELTDADGHVYVMQAWSQQVDPNLDETGLAGLDSRLALPEGWSYASRTLDETLVVDTTGSAAVVLQDELRNSYSRSADS